jgi:hypothetical protein
MRSCVTLQYVDVLFPKDIESAFQAASKGQADVILVLGGYVFNYWPNNFSKRADASG